ncbi:hypothetical protein AAFF_G00225990 [Aldrovandia affinis]|uniref:Uncharacterized protein n=1 Tax=Aldrovandia affinis TaxID=143900 RepID=A0AAD7TCQ9_9TELE|nr:hypothetical protein AAFF_G00225990 [Aldrovandia affinis]
MDGGRETVFDWDNPSVVSPRCLPASLRQPCLLTGGGARLLPVSIHGTMSAIIGPWRPLELHCVSLCSSWGLCGAPVLRPSSEVCSGLSLITLIHKEKCLNLLQESLNQYFPR